MPNSNSARIDRLFVRFYAIYGHIWQSQFKQADFLTLAKKEWDDTLQCITDENLELAFKECKKRHEMPPTLPAFYQLCRRYQPKKLTNTFVKTEEKPADRKVVEVNIKKMREVIARQ